jgi:hypothetical protein
VLDDAKIYKPVDRIQYVKYWEAQIEDLEREMKETSPANLKGFREDIDLYVEIRAKIAELTDILRDMNALTVDIHRGSGFADLIDAVEKKLNE